MGQLQVKRLEHRDMRIELSQYQERSRDMSGGHNGEVMGRPSVLWLTQDQGKAHGTLARYTQGAAQANG